MVVHDNLAQVSVEVMYVWRRPDGRTNCGSYEVQWITLGYESNCRCGANCALRPCVHLLAFWMIHMHVDPDCDTMWQTALLEPELRDMSALLRDSCALHVDCTGRALLEKMRAAEDLMVRKTSAMRATAPEGRVEAIGLRLMDVAERAREAQRAETPIKPTPRVDIKSIQKRGGSHLTAAGKRTLAKMNDVTVNVSMPVTSPTPSKSVAYHKGPKLRKKSDAEDSIRDLPLGEPRIYRNWHVRKCHGRDCKNTIDLYEFFVNVPLMNMLPSTCMLGYHNVGLCLRTEGRCLKHQTAQITHIMKQERFYIPAKLPVYSRGDQLISDEDVEFLSYCLPGREPFLKQQRM